MANKKTSLDLATALINSVDIIEQLQKLDINPENTLVDGRGIADRYVNKQATKQKQTVTVDAHWYNSGTSLEATNLDITVWSIGGTAYLGLLKNGTLDISNTGPETSGIAEAYEYPQPTTTDATVTSNLMILSAAGSALLTAAMMAGVVADFQVVVIITFAGKSVHIPGILHGSKHGVDRGQAQMEDVTIDLSGGAPTTPGDTTSLIYLALVGAAVASFDFDTGANEYATGDGQTAMISRLNMRYADKELITQSLTMEVQGGMTVTAPS